jgi:hypothetical protein
VGKVSGDSGGGWSGGEEGAEAGLEDGDLFWAGLAFPDNQELPAEFLQGFDVSAVAKKGSIVLL